MKFEFVTWSCWWIVVFSEIIIIPLSDLVSGVRVSLEMRKYLAWWWSSPAVQSQCRAGPGFRTMSVLWPSLEPGRSTAPLLVTGQPCRHTENTICTSGPSGDPGADLRNVSGSEVTRLSGIALLLWDSNSDRRTVSHWTSRSGHLPTHFTNNT